ncbi:MAG: hypothetical protein RL204_105 [Bacteroidota bacterium]|jgi:cysteine desulfurase
MEKRIYLDNAATTPLDPKVLEAMMPFMTDFFGNPSSSHSFGRKTKTAIENSRRTIAKALNCSPSEIFFTSGGTEADNLAMHSAVYDQGCKHIITSLIEHSAVIKTAQAYAEKGVAKLSIVNLLPNGHIDLAHLEQLLASNEKSFVTLMHGNNEIANLLPLEKVGELCAQYGAIFHSDTVQTMGHYKFDLNALKVHFINAAAHKFHGPKGVGFIYINKSIKVNGTITGGGQERGLRGGTENLYGIVGLGKAIELAYADIEEHQNHVSELKQYMRSRLEQEIPGITFNGDSSSPNSLYTVLNATFPPTSNFDMMLFLLDLEGVACSGGSACSSGATKGSHVLDAIGALKDGCASLRFSFSRFTTKDEIDYAVSKIKELCLAEVPA